MAVRGILRPGEVAIRVMDLAKARKHYGEILGLHETLDEGDKVYYKAWDEWDHHSVVIREADHPGIDHFAFKVYRDADLDDFASKIDDFGIAVEHIDAGVYPKSGRRIAFVLPTGHHMHLYAEKEQLGNTMGTHNPGVIPDDGVVRGVETPGLDHILLGGRDIEKNLALFTQVFEFDLVEQLIDAESKTKLAIFLSCSNKPHDVAFVLQPEDNKFHHCSFRLESAADVVKAADRLGHYRVPVDVGPNRHGVTRGATIYFFDPSGNRNEVFAEGYIRYPDIPTLTWDTDDLGHATFSQDNTPRPSFLEVLT